MRSLTLPGRRLAVAVGALVAVGLAASAMTASASSQHSTANSTLVVDKSFDLKTSDPQRQFEPTGGIVDHALYDTLLKFVGADVSHPKPDIAVSFKASSDAKTYTFQLRKNIKFSDGTPLTSKDVVFSFRRLVNLKGNPSFLLAGITTSAKGPYTVVLKSKTPNPAIPVLVANTSLGVVNSKVVMAHGGSDAANADKTDKAESYINAHSVGSGPYVLKSFSTTSQVVMTANPTYWGPKPKFPTVVLRNVSAATQLLDVQRGTNEISVDLSPDQATSLKGNSKVQVAETPSANVFFLFANHNTAVSTTTANTHIQNAIRYGLDYSGLVSLAGSGAVQAAGIVPSMFLGSLPASAGLQAGPGQGQGRGHGIGYQQPDGEPRVPERHLARTASQFGVLAQRIASDLGKIGITAKLTGSPVATALGTYRAGTEQLGLWYWGPDYPDPNDYLAFLPGATVGLRAGWPAGADPSLEALGTKAAAMSAPAKRGAAFRQIQTQLNASGPVLPADPAGPGHGLLEEPHGGRLQRRSTGSTLPPSAAADPARTRSGRSPRRSSRPFARFVAHRLGALVLLAIGITFVAFVLTQLVPGDPAAANLGQQAINDPVAVKAFREHYGLDKPLPEQYALYLWHLAHGDLGQSEQNHDAVTHDLATFAPATAELAIFSMLIAVPAGHRPGFARGDAAEQGDRSGITGRVTRGHLHADLLARSDRVLHLLLPPQLVTRARGGSTP